MINIVYSKKDNSLKIKERDSSHIKDMIIFKVGKYIGENPKKILKEIYTNSVTIGNIRGHEIIPIIEFLEIDNFNMEIKE